MEICKRVDLDVICNYKCRTKWTSRSKNDEMLLQSQPLEFVLDVVNFFS